MRNLKCHVPQEHKVDVVCRADYAVNKSDFALEPDDEGKESFHELKPSAVFVCILQCDKNGSLTEQVSTTQNLCFENFHNISSNADCLKCSVLYALCSIVFILIC